MIYKTLFALLASIGMCITGFSQPSIGIVNFTTCATESKLGKQEQASFDSLKNQMTTLIQDTESQLNDLNAKFADSDYMDGLSPEAEDEMKARKAALYDEINRYQGQYYQVMNQAQMKLIQTINASVQAASEAIAKDKELSMIVNKEVCFFTNATLDVTHCVIAEMDQQFQTASEKP